MCVDLSDYNLYLNQIYIELKHHSINMTDVSNLHELKFNMVTAAILDFEKCQ